MKEGDEDPKYASSITKLYAPFKMNLPLATYTNFAIDGSNLLGHFTDEVANVLWNHHKNEPFSEQNILNILHTTNHVVAQYFRKLEPLIRSQFRESTWIIFDGRKPKFLTWPGSKKQTYRWPFIADECVRLSRVQLQNEKDLPSRFFLFLDFIKSAIKHICEQIGIKYFVAPYEGDSQIMKMHQEGVIDCVISHDYEFSHFGVPMILKLHSDQTIDVIDFERTKHQQLQGDSLLIEWLEKADQQKRQMFSVLCGSTYISHFRSLTFRQIMELVLDSSCLRDFFPLVEKRYHIETRKIKNYHGTFEDTAHSLLLLYTFQICYSFVNKQQEPLRSHGFETFFRENKIDNKKDQVKRVEKLAPEDQVLKNKHQNKEFEKIFSLIGEIVHKYDDDERYRKGHLKIHNDKHPAKSWPVQGKTMEEKIAFVFENKVWVVEEIVRNLLVNQANRKNS